MASHTGDTHSLLSGIGKILKDKPRTMWDSADPRLNPNESWRKCIASLGGIHSKGFTHLCVNTCNGVLKKAHFNILYQGGYVFESGTLYMTCGGMNIHENGFITAEVDEWVIAEYQCGCTDREVLSTFTKVEYKGMTWWVCVQEEEE
jgi:hypothetical protein